VLTYIFDRPAAEKQLARVLEARERARIAREQELIRQEEQARAAAAVAAGLAPAAPGGGGTGT
jgi:hypothetical protein